MLQPTPLQRIAVEAVQEALDRANIKPHVTYEALGEKIFCTAHCRNQYEKIKALDAFSTVPNIGLSASENPPKVCVTVKQG